MPALTELAHLVSCDRMDVQPFWDSTFIEEIAGYLLRGLGGLLVVLVGRFIASKVRTTIRQKLSQPSMDQTLVKFGANISYYAIFVLAVLAGLQTLGVQTASFVAVLAAAGFAIGLALQGTLANVAAGILLLIFRPFNVGYYVEIGGEKGYVRDLQLFFTKLDTRKNQLVIVPNGDIFGSTIRNLFFYDEIRVDCAVGTDYPEDIDATRDVLLKAAATVDGRIEDRGEQASIVSLW